MGILVFGTGKYYETYKFWLEQLEIVALLDNAKSKQSLGRIDLATCQGDKAGL